MPRDNTVSGAGPQQRTLNEIVDINYFVPTENLKDVLEGDDYDYVIIGTGPCAYSFLRHTLLNIRKDAKILILERGAFFLPDHVQALDEVYSSMLGGITETFPFERSDEMKARDKAVYAHGSVNVVGGRSSVWTAWCPWPEKNTDGTNPTELRGFPDAFVNHVARFRREAEGYLNADGRSNASIFNPNAFPLSVLLEKEMQKIAEDNRNLTLPSDSHIMDERIIPNVGTVFNKAYIAPIASNRANSMNPFGKFSSTAPLLNLIRYLRPSPPYRRKPYEPTPFENAQGGANRQVNNENKALWKRIPVPSFLYILHCNFVEIASESIKLAPKLYGEEWFQDNESTVELLKSIWGIWESLVIAGQLGVSYSSNSEKEHANEVAKQLFFEISQVYGQPLKELKYPFCEHAEVLFETAKLLNDQFDLNSFSHRQSVDTFTYRFDHGEKEDLPNVTVTCVTNAFVSKLHCSDQVNNHTSPPVTGIDVLFSEGPNFGDCCDKSKEDGIEHAEDCERKTRKYIVKCKPHTKIIVAAGMYPAANLLNDSFDDPSIGKDIGAHFCGSVLARIKRNEAKKLFKDKTCCNTTTNAAFGSTDYAEAIYLSGYNTVPNGSNPASSIPANEWHAQLSIIIPSYASGARGAATLAASIPGGPDSMHRTSDPDYVYFNFSMLGEILTNEVERAIMEETTEEVRERNKIVAENQPQHAAEVVGATEGLIIDTPYTKSNSYKKGNVDAVNNNPLLRPDGGEAILDLRLSKLDYTSWQKMIEIPQVIMEKFIGVSGDITVEYHNRRTKEWGSDVMNPSAGEEKYKHNMYADFCSTGLVHEGCVLRIDTPHNNNTGSVYASNEITSKHLRYQYKKASNVFVTGAGLLPSTASWNPTSYLCAMAVDLAENLLAHENGGFDGDDGKIIVTKNAFTPSRVSAAINLARQRLNKPSSVLHALMMSSNDASRLESLEKKTKVKGIQFVSTDGSDIPNRKEINKFIEESIGKEELNEDKRAVLERYFLYCLAKVVDPSVTDDKEKVSLRKLYRQHI